MRDKIISYVYINLGILIMGLGLYLFLIPCNLAVGGVTGLAMVIKNYLPGINLGVLMIFFNAILFIMAFFIIGKEFARNSIFCSFLLSALIGFFEIVLPLKQPIVDDIMLNLIFGIMIQGIGMAIIFYQNASTGGTDIVAKIINKYIQLEIGKALFLSDALIILLAGLTFGLLLGLYSFLGILINGIVIDKVIAGFNIKNQVLVITKTNCVNEFIQSKLKRGSTLINGEGGYSKERKQIISVVLTRKEYIKLKHFIRDNDPTAFVTVSIVHEVLGEGFDSTLQVV